MLVRDNFFVSYADKKRAEDLRGPFPCGRCCKGKSDQIHQIQNEGPLTMPHEQSACSFRKSWSRQVIFSCLTPLLPCGAVYWSCCSQTGLSCIVWKWNKCTEEPVSAVPELTWEVRQKVVLPVRNRFKRPEPYSVNITQQYFTRRCQF